MPTQTKPQQHATDPRDVARGINSGARQQYRQLVNQVVEGAIADNAEVLDALPMHGRTSAQFVADVDCATKRRKAVESLDQSRQFQADADALAEDEEAKADAVQVTKKQADEMMQKAYDAHRAVADRQQQLRVDAKTLGDDALAVLLETCDPAIADQQERVKEEIASLRRKEQLQSLTHDQRDAISREIESLQESVQAMEESKLQWENYET